MYGCRPRISRSSLIPVVDGRNVKWWCITAPPLPATVAVSRRTWLGSGCALTTSCSAAAIASESVRLVLPRRGRCRRRWRPRRRPQLGQPAQRVAERRRSSPRRRPAGEPARSATTNVQPADLAGADAGQALVAVVAPGQHLQHRPRCPGRSRTSRWPSSRTSGSVLRDHRRRSARRGPARPGARRGGAGACGRRRRRGRGCGAAAAGRTRRTPRRGRGRTTTGKRTCVAATSRSSARPAGSRSASSGGGSRSHARSSVVTTVASAAARCWARKIRNTAASSSGVRSSSVTP